MTQRLQTQKAMQSIPISVPPIAVAARSARSDPCMYKVQVIARTNTISTPKTKGRQLLRTARNNPLLANLCLLMGFRGVLRPVPHFAKLSVCRKHFSIYTTNGAIRTRPARAVRYFDASKVELDGGGDA